MSINGLLRQYFRKGSDLSRHTTQDLQAVEDRLNNRPRKTLGWRTPAEILPRPCHHERCLRCDDRWNPPCRKWISFGCR